MLPDRCLVSSAATVAASRSQQACQARILPPLTTSTQQHRTHAHSGKVSRKLLTRFSRPTTSLLDRAGDTGDRRLAHRKLHTTHDAQVGLLAYRQQLLIHYKTKQRLIYIAQFLYSLIRLLQMYYYKKKIAYTEHDYNLIRTYSSVTYRLIIYCY